MVLVVQIIVRIMLREDITGGLIGCAVLVLDVSGNGGIMDVKKKCKK